MMYELLGRPGNHDKAVCEISVNAQPSFEVSEDGWCWILRAPSQALLSAISRHIDDEVAGLHEITSDAVWETVRRVWEEWHERPVDYIVFRNNGEPLGVYTNVAAAEAALGNPDENYIEVRR